MVDDTTDTPPAVEDRYDVDLCLRLVTQLFREALARAALPPGTDFKVVGWSETQLAARQRRMDRVLTVQLPAGPHRIHYEWELTWDAGIAFRVFEYHFLHALAASSPHKGATLPPTHESHVVVLSGPESPLPTEGAYRTTAAHSPFGGVPFVIDAVYQRTVAELGARGPLWLMFAPLAHDATPDAMPRVLEDLRAQVPSPRHFRELAIASLVLADADGRERGLRTFLEACLPREVVVKSWVYQQGQQKGVEQGIEQGLRWMRDALYATLAARKIRVTAARRQQIESETRPEVLTGWLERTATATRLADVLGPRPAS